MKKLLIFNKKKNNLILSLFGLFFFFSILSIHNGYNVEASTKSFSLVKGTGFEKNLIKINWREYRGNEVFYKVIDDSGSCAANKDQAQNEGYLRTVDNIFLSNSDSNKRLCVLGSNSSGEITTEEINTGDLSNEDDINIGLKEIQEVMLNGKVKEIGTTKAFAIDNDTILLFGTVSNDTCELVGSNNRGCDKAGFTPENKTHMNINGSVYSYKRSTGELKELEGVTNNLTDGSTITQDSIAIHDKEKNRIIFLGGYKIDEKGNFVDGGQKIVKSFDITTKTWSNLNGYKISQGKDTVYDTVGGLYGREIIFFYSNSFSTNEMNFYNIDTGVTRTVQLSNSENFHSSGFLILGDELYVAGGFTGNGYSDKFKKINLITGQVSLLPRMLSEREDSTTVLIGNKMYLISGGISNVIDGKKHRDVTDDIEYFDFEKKLWVKSKYKLPKKLTYGNPVLLNGELLIIGGIILEGIDLKDQLGDKSYKEIENSDGTFRKTYVEFIQGTTKKIEKHYSQSPKIFSLVLNNLPIFESAESLTKFNKISGKHEVSFVFKNAFDDGTENGKNSNQEIYGEYSKDGGNTWLKCGDNVLHSGNKGDYICKPSSEEDRDFGNSFNTGDKLLVRLNDGINYTEPKEVTIREIDRKSPIITGPSEIEVKVGEENFNIMEGINTDEGTIDDITVKGNYDINKVGIYRITLEQIDDDGNRAEKIITIRVVEEDKTKLNEEINRSKFESNNEKVITDDNKSRLENKIGEIESLDKTNLTKKQIQNLIDELRDLTSKLVKDTENPLIKEKLGKGEVSAEITDDNLNENLIFFYEKGKENEKKKYKSGDSIKIDDSWSGKTIVIEAEDKYGNKSIKEIENIYEKVKVNHSNIGAGGYSPMNNELSTGYKINNLLIENGNENNKLKDDSMGKISIRIEDQLGNEIQPNIIIEGKIGDSYDLRNNVPSIDGYEILETSNLNGIIGDNSEVLIKFQRLSDKKLDIIDNEENDISIESLEENKKVKLPTTGVEIKNKENFSNSTIILLIIAFLLTTIPSYFYISKK